MVFLNTLCIIFLILVQIWFVEANDGANLTGIPPCKAYNCSLERCHVDCDGLNLTSIPISDIVPSSLITEFTLTDNTIRYLPTAGFARFTNLRILKLSRNPLEYIRNSSFIGLNSLTELYICHARPEARFLILESDVISPLTSITFLDLSFSSIPIAPLFQAFCNLSENIDVIVMNKMHTHSIRQSTNMPCFHRLKVKQISLDDSDIGHMDPNFIFNIPSVEYLSLRLNRLDWYVDNIFGLNLHNLTFFYSSCQIKITCDNKYPWLEWLPNTPKLYKENSTMVGTIASTTKISDKSKLYQYFFPNLQTLILRDLSSLKINTKSNIASLYTVPCWANNRLRYLNLRGIKALTIGVETFHDMPSLEVLMLGSAGIPEGIFEQPNSASFFVNNRELRFLDLSNLGLTSLYKDIFQSLNKLESLILSHNKLINVQSRDVSLPSILNIDLSNNKLRNIPLTIIWKNVKFNMLHLSNNPFICGCFDIYILHEILRSNFSIPDAHKTNGSLNCNLADNRNVALNKAFDILLSECFSTSFTFVTVVYPLTICFILFTVCCFRYRWKMKYVYYNLQLCVNRRNSNDADAQFYFDAFVAHSGKDEEWVRTILIRTLET